MIGIPRSDMMMLVWLALAALLWFGASFALLTWRQVRGVRGLALATAMASAALIASMTGVMHSPQVVVPFSVLLAVQRAGWGPLTLGLLVLSDLYAADHNNHRAVTTILYLRWDRWRARKG
jgi:cytochrome bd-type quinol oxidase subunit 2